MQVVFDHIQNEGLHFKTFWFEPEKPVRYTAGQFTELRLPHENMDNRGDKRWFTISSSPTDELLSITTRIDPKRPSSFKRALLELKHSQPLHLADAMGDFVLPITKDTPIVFVAGGVGITPMHSMIKWLVDVGETRDIKLYYGAHKLEDILFRDLFEHAPITFEIILEQPPSHWKGRTGRLTSDVIAALPGVMQKALVYLSGPEPMIEALYKELKEKGVPEHRLITDYFPGYTEANI